MPVGAAIGSGQVDNLITALAVQMRNVMTEISRLSKNVNGQGNGLAFLESIGYSGTANPDNPGGISDAQLAQNTISYLNTMSAVYFGAATQGTTFDFDQQLSAVWGGRVE